VSCRPPPACPWPHYEQTATPFEWKFTRSDLHRLLARTAQLDLAQAA
jgi:hypothetical protein